MPTGLSYQPPLVDADAPSFASSAFSLVSPSRNVGGDDVDFLDRSASDAVLLDGDLLCLVFQHIFVATGPICSRVNCPCTSTYNGGELGHCCRTCFRGRACTHNIHRTPFHPLPPLRPGHVHRELFSCWRFLFLKLFAECFFCEKRCQAGPQIASEI